MDFPSGGKTTVILGAGIAGHTAAQKLRQLLPADHRVHVVSPNADWNWVPSNIWVGVGLLPASATLVPLQPVYQKLGIEFTQAKATELHPEGDASDAQPFIVAQRANASEPTSCRIPYDYLINATGPKLNFAATPGLGPGNHTVSVCTAAHAEQAGGEFLRIVDRLKAGEKLTLVVGVGHGLCTCEGAAFEYVFNVEFELRRHGVRDRARLVFLTNEAQLGDFGVGGLHITTGGYVTPSKTFAESLFSERGVEWITGVHVQKIEPGQIFYEDLQGTDGVLNFDFAMLLPPFRGQDLKAFDREAKEITSELFAPNGFMKVDANYTPAPYEQWRASDWPMTYQNPKYQNIFAIGIAFAPPHPISRPRTSVKGTPISPAPPRTGMPSAVMGRAAAQNICDLITGQKTGATHHASLAELGAACVASAGVGFLHGTAASMTMYPIVPDFQRYPMTGRSLKYTFGEIGSAGHWIKKLLHYAFIYKAKARPLWWLIPE